MDSHGTSPIEIARALIAAENAHDVDGAMALFAPDPTVKLSMATLTTTEAVQRWQEELAAGNLHIEVDEMQAEGNIARWTGMIAVDLFRRMGLQELSGSWEIAVEKDKITAFTFGLSPDAAALVQAASQKG
jgi:hypothetical protein